MPETTLNVENINDTLFHGLYTLEFNFTWSLRQSHIISSTKAERIQLLKVFSSDIVKCYQMGDFEPMRFH